MHKYTSMFPHAVGPLHMHMCTPSYVWLMSPTAAYAGEHEHFSEACVPAECNHTNEKFMS